MPKKVLLAVFILLTAVLAVRAEGVRLKNGTILTGTIIDQSEYILNFKTKFGVVSIPLQNVAEIMPDKQKVTIKGGGEIIGVIEDIDQFNIRMKTDNGYVNIDMSKVASVDVYDYEQAEQQEKYVKQQQQAAEQATQKAAEKEAAVAAGGISFDDDIDRIFTPKAPAEGVEYIPVRNDAPAPAVSAPAAPAAADVYKGQVSQKDLSAVKTPEDKTDAKSKAAQETEKSNLEMAENAAAKYLAVEAGAFDNSLKYNGADVGGIGIGLNLKYFWRVLRSNLWAGPVGTVSLAPAKTIDLPSESQKISGQIFQFALGANYYLTPKSKYQTYLTASVGYESLSLDIKRDDTSDPTNFLPNQSASSSGLIYGGGLGVERRFGDTSLGIEAKAYQSSRSGEGLDGSPSTFFSVMLKTSWKF